MVLDTLWQEFLKIIGAEVGSRIVETWFKALTIVKWDTHAKTMYLAAPNVFIKDWVESHYRPLFNQHLGRLLNETSVHIAFTDTIRTQPSASSATRERIESPDVAHKKFVPARIQSNTRGLLTPHHQFDSFVVGTTNSLAYSAAQAVAENPGCLYNPLLIWGQPGTGKTHLLQAIGHHLRMLNKKTTILYQSADRFVDEFIAAARADKIYQFEARYKSVDVLLMDDIQYMSNKEQTQEIFFQIFNTLYQARKQVVFTSDALPHDLTGLHERIRSRLEGGLVADIQSATLDTRTAILHKKAALHNVMLSQTVAELMASQGGQSVRELEGTLIRVLACASFTSQPITLELVTSVLEQRREQKKQTTDLATVIKHVSRHFNYPLPEIRSPKRSKELALARHVAVYLMKKLTDRSLREIALFLERKDHSTILHAVAKIEEARNQDAKLAALLEHLEHKILA